MTSRKQPNHMTGREEFANSYVLKGNGKEVKLNHNIVDALERKGVTKFDYPSKKFKLLKDTDIELSDFTKTQADILSQAYLMKKENRHPMFVFDGEKFTLKASNNVGNMLIQNRTFNSLKAKDILVKDDKAYVYYIKPSVFDMFKPKPSFITKNLNEIIMAIKESTERNGNLLMFEDNTLGYPFTMNRVYSTLGIEHISGIHRFAEDDFAKQILKEMLNQKLIKEIDEKDYVQEDKGLGRKINSKIYYFV